MRIITFGVNNFRGISGGIQNNTIEFKDSNTIFLLGQNNVGKSSFLMAYDFFYKNTSPKPEDIFRMDPENIIEFEIVLQLDDFDFKKESIKQKSEGLKKWLNEDNLLKIRKVLKPKGGKKITFENTENYTWDYNAKSWEAKNYGGIGLDNVFRDALPTPILIKAMPSESEVETIINQVLKSKAEINFKDKEREELKAAQAKIQELQDKLYNPESIKKYKEEVNKHFQELFPQTSIELEEQDKVKWTEHAMGKKFSIHFEKKNPEGEKDENIPTTYDKIGHGAIRSAIFSLLLMKDIAEEFHREENRKDYIVLFEEPELFLHPKLMKQLRSLIYRVSESKSPYQIICASHSPQMIDITKENSSLVRMVKGNEGTKFHQINDEFLKKSKKVRTKQELKQEMHEVLRFNPFICESFYADEVILIEGPTEEIILRGYLTEKKPEKELFVINCGTVNNIPFYQKIFSKFFIKYHIICDTDSSEFKEDVKDELGLTIFSTGIQKSIYKQYKKDVSKKGYSTGLFHYHEPTFEPAHQVDEIPETLKYSSDYNNSDGKPYNANLYWKDTLYPNLENDEIYKVPILNFLNNIINAE
ncbi:ATP-dependent nuclease [Luteirhabdus pelagi]|uniref:ATP-dependent nuclease n=1 Tax=Luteirhabdus pelagi TaxID=2792783 RepID=UPI0019395E27|nr:AAA family ATPase [Luteirhabdus pelagi]